MNATSFHLLLLELVAALDTGKYDAISIDEVHRHAADRTLIPWLAKTLAGDTDFSVVGEPRHSEPIHAAFEDMYGGYSGQHESKWGVRNRGLCLVVAWAVEIIAKRV